MGGCKYLTCQLSKRKFISIAAELSFSMPGCLARNTANSTAFTREQFVCYPAVNLLKLGLLCIGYRPHNAGVMAAEADLYQLKRGHKFILRSELDICLISNNEKLCPCTHLVLCAESQPTATDHYLLGRRRVCMDRKTKEGKECIIESPFR